MSFPVVSVNTMSALRNIVGSNHGEVVVVAGYLSPGDGGGGEFAWHSNVTPSAADNQGTIIIPNGYTGTGRWLRIYSGPVNVRWFGAVRNDSTIDVSNEVRKAIQIANGGTIYFPQGTYALSVELSNTNIIGDGRGSMLIAYAGQPALQIWPSTFTWTFKKVANVYIYGTSIINGITYVADGVEFGIYGLIPANAGAWIFEQVTFESCNRAIFKNKGNIGNSFIDCNWLHNNFGYYAQGYNPPQPPEPVPENLKPKHAGCDKFIRGEMNTSKMAAIFLKDDTNGFGQLVVENTIIEGNQGFGVLVKLSKTASITHNALTFNNVWMEANTVDPDDLTRPYIEIDYVKYKQPEISNYYFEGVRSVSIRDGIVNKLKAVASSVTLYSCRVDNGGNDAQVSADTYSSIVSYETRNEYNGSSDVFHQSISYDFTPTVGPASSYWSPLRSMLVKKTGGVLYSDFYNTAKTFSNLANTISIPETPQNLGVLQSQCIGLALNPGYDVSDKQMFTVNAGKRYLFYSFHTCLRDGDATVVIDDNAGFLQGRSISKLNEWSCTIGIKHINLATSVTPRIWIRSVNGGTILIADIQVIEFTNLYDALSWANSRAYALDI